MRTNAMYSLISLLQWFFCVLGVLITSVITLAVTSLKPCIRQEKTMGFTPWFYWIMVLKLKTWGLHLAFYLKLSFHAW